jgi:acetyl-CoA carboxylase carboxyl transferase subunit alpha
MSTTTMSNQPEQVAASTLGFLEFESKLFEKHRRVTELETQQADDGKDLTAQIKKARTQFRNMLKRTYSNLTPWETVLVARHPQRPLITDYIRLMVDDFCELHGDRTFGDDPAIITGFGRIAGHKVMLIGHNKGKDTKERLACNFGCAHPEGYRKALLKMKIAAKFGLPIVAMIDTQGAYPGVGAEERGISQAIAVNLLEMSRIPTPTVCVVIGEGGSGGALGIGVGDRVAMFKHSFYSVISPEGCAAILWKTSDQRKHAAEALRLTSHELEKLGIIDHIIDEPVGGAHRAPKEAAILLDNYLGTTLRELKKTKLDTLLNRRYERIRNIASFFENPADKPKKSRKTPSKNQPQKVALPKSRVQSKHVETVKS